MDVYLGFDGDDEIKEQIQNDCNSIIESINKHLRAGQDRHVSDRELASIKDLATHIKEISEQI